MYKKNNIDYIIIYSLLLILKSYSKSLIPFILKILIFKIIKLVYL